jgi:hypothetical protein
MKIIRISYGFFVSVYFPIMCNRQSPQLREALYTSIMGCYFKCAQPYKPEIATPCVDFIVQSFHITAGKNFDTSPVYVSDCMSCLKLYLALEIII